MILLIKVGWDKFNYNSPNKISGVVYYSVNGRYLSSMCKGIIQHGIWLDYIDRPVVRWEKCWLHSVLIQSTLSCLDEASFRENRPHPKQPWRSRSFRASWPWQGLSFRVTHEIKRSLSSVNHERSIFEIKKLQEFDLKTCIVMKRCTGESWTKSFKTFTWKRARQILKSRTKIFSYKCYHFQMVNREPGESNCMCSWPAAGAKSQPELKQ